MNIFQTKTIQLLYFIFRTKNEKCNIIKITKVKHSFILMLGFFIGIEFEKIRVI